MAKKNRLEIIATMRDDLSRTLKRINAALDKTEKGVKDTGRASKTAGRNVEKLGRKMKTAGTRSGGLYQAIKRLSRGLSNLKFLIGAAAAAFGVFLLARTTTNIIKTAAAVQRLTSEIGTLLGNVSDKNLQDLNFAIRNMAVKGGQSLENEFKAAYDAISAGIPRERLMEFLEATNKLAVAGVTDVATATDLLTTVINSYNISMDDMESVMDSLFMTVRLGKLRIVDLANAIGRVAPIAEKVGLSLDEMNAGVAVLTISGLKTEEATTALRQMLNTLLDLTPKAVKGLKELGMSSLFSLDALRSKGLGVFVRDLAAATEGQEDKIALFVSNIRALTGTLSLVNEEGAKVNAFLDQYLHKQGAAEEAFRKMSNTFAFQFDRLKALIEAIKTDIGNLMLPALFNATKKFVDVIQDVRVAFKQLNDVISASGEGPGAFLNAMVATTMRKELIGATKAFIETALVTGLKVLGTGFIHIITMAANLFATLITRALGDGIVAALSRVPGLSSLIDFKGDALTRSIIEKSGQENKLEKLRLTQKDMFENQDIFSGSTMTGAKAKEVYERFKAGIQKTGMHGTFTDLMMQIYGKELGVNLRDMVEKAKQMGLREFSGRMIQGMASGDAMLAVGDNMAMLKEALGLVQFMVSKEIQKDINDTEKEIESLNAAIDRGREPAGEQAMRAMQDMLRDMEDVDLGPLQVAYELLVKTVAEVLGQMPPTAEVLDAVGGSADKSSSFIDKLAKSFSKLKNDAIGFVRGFAGGQEEAFSTGQMAILNALGLSDRAQLIQLKQDLIELNALYGDLINQMKATKGEQAGALAVEALGIEQQIKAKEIEIFRHKLQQDIIKAQKEFNKGVKLLNVEQQGGMWTDAQFAVKMKDAQKAFNVEVQKSVDKMDELKVKYPELTELIDESKLKMLEVLDVLKQSKDVLSQTEMFVVAFGNSLTTARDLSTELGSIIGSQLGTAIDSVVTGAKSMGAAFRDMAIGIVQDLIKIIVKMMVIQSLNMMFGGAGLGATSFFGIGANKGGLIPGFSRGGRVGGSGPDRDSVPAMLTPGEFVLRRSAVQSLGVNLLTALNNVNMPGRLPMGPSGPIRGYNAGGSVTKQTQAPTPAYVVANERSMQSLLSGGKAAMIEFLRSNRDSFLGDARHVR